MEELFAMAIGLGIAVSLSSIKRKLKQTAYRSKQ